MYKVDQKKWENFSKSIQLKNIAVEMARATKAALFKKEDTDWLRGAYERAMAMTDASLNDPKWTSKSYLYELRNAIASLYVENINPSLSQFIYSQTMKEAEALTK